MSLWMCPKCQTLTAPEHGPCPKCGTPTVYVTSIVDEIHPHTDLTLITTTDTGASDAT